MSPWLKTLHAWFCIPTYWFLGLIMIPLYTMLICDNSFFQDCLRCSNIVNLKTDLVLFLSCGFNVIGKNSLQLIFSILTKLLASIKIHFFLCGFFWCRIGIWINLTSFLCILDFTSILICLGSYTIFVKFQWIIFLWYTLSCVYSTRFLTLYRFGDMCCWRVQWAMPFSKWRNLKMLAAAFLK